MAAKTATGVPGLDSMLGGGFPRNSTILLEAPPGTGKSTFCKQFVREAVKVGEPCIYVATSEPVGQVVTRLKGMGVANFSQVSFIDGYSWRIPEAAAEPAENIKALKSLTELNELTRMIKKEMKRLPFGKAGGRIIIDSLSDMLLYADPASVFRFLQLFVGIVKSSHSTAMVVLEQGLHEPRHVATISYICDGTIHLKLDGDKRSIYVERMFNTVHPLKWIPFTLGEHGVEIKVEDFFK